MKYLLLALPLIAFAGDKKPLPGQAGNDDIELTGSVMTIPAEMKAALGEDIGAGFVIVRIKVTPKTEKPLRISPDDFTIVSGKDGQRSQALSPGQIAGKGALVVKAAANQPGGEGTMTNGPVWGGIGGMSRNSRGGNTKGADGAVDTQTNNEAKADDALLAALKAKQLPDQESKDPLEGLLYFPIDGKIKPKDLRIIYQGRAGKLIMEFAPK